MRSWVNRIILVSSALVLLGTSAKGQPLTRPIAERLINKNPDFASTLTLPGIPDDPAFKKALNESLWQQSAQGFVATPEGAPLFRDASFLGINLRNPLHRAVSSITGIADGSDAASKVAEFTWHFTDLTERLSIFTGATTGDHQGEAALRHYDDGWRVTKVQIGSYNDGTNSRPFFEAKLTGIAAVQQTVDRVCQMAVIWRLLGTDKDAATAYCIRKKCEGPVTYQDFLTAAVAAHEGSSKNTWEFDGWGQPYRFFVTKQGASYEVRSLGAGGKLKPAIKGESAAADSNIALTDQGWVVRPAASKVGTDSAGYHHNNCDARP